MQRSIVRSRKVIDRSSASVKELMDIMADAEVRGDEQDVIRLMKLLRNRSNIPIKVLSFHDDYRPGYVGKQPCMIMQRNRSSHCVLQVLGHACPPSSVHGDLSPKT